MQTAKVNYVREMEGFRDYAEANALSAGERLVWQALFHIFNARAWGEDWPGGYVEIRTKEVAAASGLSRMTITRAREKLARRGLVDFIPGYGENATSYKMRYFSVEGAPAAVVENNTNTINALVDNFGGSAQTEQGSAQNGQGSAQNGQGSAQIEQGSAQSEQALILTASEDNNINADINLKINEEEEDIYNTDNSAGARGSMYEREIGEGYREEVGRAPSPAEIREIAEVAEWNRADGSLVREAVARGAKANYPCRYAIKCLMSWGDAGIRTREELVTYERYEQLTRAARPDIAMGAREKMRAFLRDIKIKHGMVNAI